MNEGVSGTPLLHQPSSSLSFLEAAVLSSRHAGRFRPPQDQGSSLTNLLCVVTGAKDREPEPDWKQCLHFQGNWQDVPACCSPGQVPQTLQSLREPKENVMRMSRQPPGGCSGCNKTGFPTGRL